MTTLLQQAFNEAAQLPPEEQEAFGAWMLEELRSEQRWHELFARSQELLEQMAENAITEHNAGSTRRLDFDE